MDAPDLRQELPFSIEQELERNLASGENVLIALAGSFGEALAVTDRRALVLRERDSGGGIEVFSHPLGQVTGAQAVSSSTGGCLQLRLAKPAARDDAARVYFPSHDLERFQAAAESVSALVATKAEAVLPAAEAAPSEPLCPGCGARLEFRTTFCTKCGKQLRAICSCCQSPSPVGSEFCGSCGTKMVEFVPTCRNCGGRIMRWMSFCPECGSVQGAKCAACGSEILQGMNYCASCGRRPGSSTIDHSAVRRVRQQAQAATEAERSVESAPPQQAVVSSTEAVSAEQHNARGREHFEAERLDDAIKEFEEAVRLGPSNASYRCNLAVAYDEAERDGDALEQYRRCLEIDPNDLTALLSLGYLHSEQDEFDKAREAWSKILVISPDSPEAQEARENLRTQQQL